MRRVLIIIFWCILIIPISFAQIIINEIMANPMAGNSLNEWIEIYNGGTEKINLTECVFGDSGGNDSLVGGYYHGEGMILNPNSYAIITNEMTRVYNNFNVSSNVLRIYTDGSIGYRGLSNTGEKIYIYDKGKLVDSVEYIETDQGMSYARFGNAWNESKPTPGYANNGSLYVVGSGDCDWYLELNYNISTFYEYGDLNLKIIAKKNQGEKTNLSSKIIIYDLQGNVIKQYKPFTNYKATSRKSSYIYNPVLDIYEGYIIESNLTTKCNDNNMQNNHKYQIILPKNKDKQLNSVINIENIYDIGSDNKARFGQTIRIRLNIYKGETTKKTVKTWIEKKGEKISKISQLNIEEEFSNQTFTVPIQLIPNCDEDEKKGDYNIKVEGLDATDQEEVYVEGTTSSLCEEIEVEKKIKGKMDYKIIDMPYSVKINEEFEVEVFIENNYNDDIEVEIWSYVYRGSKKYSDEKANYRYLDLEEDETKEIDLPITIKEGEEGNYKLKVKILKEGRKTPYEITKEIYLEVDQLEEEKSSIVLQEKDSEDIINEKETVTKVEIIRESDLVYESNTFLIKKMIPFFLILLFLCAVLFSIIALKKN